MAAPDIAANKTSKVRTEYLDFDASNPRLVEEGIKKSTDSQIILALADVADLGELVESIAANGYIDIEPIVARRFRQHTRGSG